MRENGPCAVCAGRVKPSKNPSLHCSDKCRREGYRRRHGLDAKIGADYHRASNGVVVGTLRELIVCVDLMRKGFDVFRALSASSKCDLVAIHRETGKVLRIEVKSGNWSPTGKVKMPTYANRELFDVGAVVHGNSITYFPEPTP